MIKMHESYMLMFFEHKFYVIMMMMYECGYVRAWLYGDIIKISRIS